MNKISGVLITLDEEEYIRRCLDNILPHVDEMIVVDGGSKDKTVEMAMDMGATVFCRKFERDFGAQKSFAVSKASYPWVMLIDADETCEKGIWEILPALASQEVYDIFGFTRKNIYADAVEIDPKDLEDESRWHNWPDIQHRFFRNYIRYSGILHESPVGWKNSAPSAYLNYIESGSIIHHKTWKRQHLEDDLYFLMRPNDYPDRLAKEGNPNENLQEE